MDSHSRKSRAPLFGQFPNNRARAQASYHPPGPAWKIFICFSAALTLLFSFVASAQLSYPGERFHARIPIVDALLSAAQNGFREDGDLLFAAGLCLGTALIFAFFRFSRSPRARLACLLMGLAPPLFLFASDLGYRSPGEVTAAVARYELALPAQTLRIFTTGEDGEFYQDALVAGPAAGWWLLLWLALGAREIVRAFQRLFRGRRAPAPHLSSNLQRET